MKGILYIFLFSFALAGSCTKIGFTDNYPDKVSFEITDHLLEGEKILCIEVDHHGNLYTGGEKLYIINGINVRAYDLDCDILSLSSGPDKNLWIGTAGKGLACFDYKNFKWYNKENSGFPRD